MRLSRICCVWCEPSSTDTDAAPTIIIRALYACIMRGTCLWLSRAHARPVHVIRIVSLIVACDGGTCIVNIYYTRAFEEIGIRIELEYIERRVRVFVLCVSIVLPAVRSVKVPTSTSKNTLRTNVQWSGDTRMRVVVVVTVRLLPALRCNSFAATHEVSMHTRAPGTYTHDAHI